MDPVTLDLNRHSEIESFHDSLDRLTEELTCCDTPDIHFHPRGQAHGWRVECLVCGKWEIGESPENAAENWMEGV